MAKRIEPHNLVEDQWIRRALERLLPRRAPREQDAEVGWGAGEKLEPVGKDTSQTSETLAGILENLKESRVAHVWVHIFMVPVDVIPDPTDGEPVILYNDDYLQEAKDDPRIGCLLCNMSLNQGWEVPCSAEDHVS